MMPQIGCEPERERESTRLAMSARAEICDSLTQLLNVGDSDPSPLLARPDESRPEPVLSPVLQINIFAGGNPEIFFSAGIPIKCFISNVFFFGKLSIVFAKTNSSLNFTKITRI